MKFTINAANHILIVHDDHAQVPILHDDMVVRDNVQSDSVVCNNVVDSAGVDNYIAQSVGVYDNVVESVDELTKALHFALQLILSVRQDLIHRAESAARYFSVATAVGGFPDIKQVALLASIPRF